MISGLLVRDPGLAGRAESLSARLCVPLLETIDGDEQPWLELTRHGLSLVPPSEWKLPPLRIDFLTGTLAGRLRKGRHAAPRLARACLVRDQDPPHILDLTAGLGRDGLLLASLGCRVTLVERHPVVHALLEDALLRAGEALPWVDERVALLAGDACLLDDLPRAEVVYLDPMFPARDKSALVKKEMQIFHHLVGTGHEDATCLLERARSLALKRVVVKRPRRAPPLAGVPPHAAIEGRTTRYDLYPVI